MSVGIGLYPEDGGEADVLLKAADVAMYRSKQQTALPLAGGPTGTPESSSG